jgi:hypothetical protein
MPAEMRYHMRYHDYDDHVDPDSLRMRPLCRRRDGPEQRQPRAAEADTAQSFSCTMTFASLTLKSSLRQNLDQIRD